MQENLFKVTTPIQNSRFSRIMGQCCASCRHRSNVSSDDVTETTTIDQTLEEKSYYEGEVGHKQDLWKCINCNLQTITILAKCDYCHLPREVCDSSLLITNDALDGSKTLCTTGNPMESDDVKKYTECWVCTGPDCSAMNNLLDTLRVHNMCCAKCHCATYVPGQTEIVMSFEWDGAQCRLKMDDHRQG